MAVQVTGGPSAPTRPGDRPSTADRRRAAARWVVGDLPVRYWLILLVVYIAGYAYYHADHRAYTGDGEYYTVMALRDAGYGYGQALNAAGVYFHDPHIWRLDYGFFSPNFRLLLLPRVVYPALSAPFVWLVGPGGIWVVPAVCGLITLWGVVRLLGRFYGSGITLALTALFLTTIAFWEFGTGAYTEPVCIALVVVMLYNLPLGRRVGRRNAAALAICTVALTFTRQMTVVVVCMVLAPYLWSVLARRTWRTWRGWRTEWFAPAVATTVSGGVAYYLMQRWAPYDPWPQFLSTAGTKSKKEALLHLPAQAWHLLGQDNSTYLRSDTPMLVLWLIALAVLVVRLRTPQAALFFGAAGSSEVFAVVDGTASGMRYFFPMYPVLLLAAGEVLRWLARRGRALTWEPGGPEAAAAGDGRSAAGQPAPSAASRATASASTPADLQNANRTKDEPASTSS